MPTGSSSPEHPGFGRLVGWIGIAAATVVLALWYLAVIILAVRRRGTLPRSPTATATSIVALGGLLVITSASSVAAQRPLNLDFERSSVSHVDRPWGWTLGWSAFAGGPAASFELDSAIRMGGRRSLRIAWPDSISGAAPQSIMLQIPAGFARGREVRLDAWARTKGIHGRALITLEAWKDREFAAADTASVGSTGSVAGSSDWTRHDLGIRVSPDPAVHSIVITLSLEAPGTAWFDNLTLAVDGEPVTALPSTADPPTASELARLAGHMAPLRGVEPVPPMAGGGDAADLRLIADIVGSARIVGLGESTHGTREFFQVKHRLLEYLVREHGFTVFAIEANQLAVERINRYVQGGGGTARDAMRVMFRVWNTEEMLDLIEWMRAHNAAYPDRVVRFAGYDMQDHGIPGDTLRAFLARSNPSMVQRFDDLLGEYRAQRSWATPQMADTTRGRWHRQADELWRMVSGRRSVWLSTAPTADDSVAVEWAVQAANLMRQAAGLNATLSSPDRDSLMAANLDWLLRTLAPDARAVVWAHDVHVSRGGDPTLSFNGGAQMGAYLARTYGHDYRAFSLLTHTGAYSATRSFTDHEMIEAEAFPGPPGSIEAALHGLERDQPSAGWIVDLRHARSDPAAEWLRRPRPIRHIGFAAYDYGFELDAVLPLEFDGIVFVDHTSPSRLLRRSPPAAAYVDSLRIALDLPALSVAVAENGRVVWEHATGWEDPAVERPATPSSVFRIGSVSKLLTAAALARLADRGELDLDRPVRAWVPAAPESSPPITPRLLAGHVAGIRHYGRSEFVSRTHYPGVTATLARFIDDPLVAPPGTRYAYSSYGYDLLGAVLERAADKDFRTLIHDEVVSPLGLGSVRAAGPTEDPGEVRYFFRDQGGAVVDAPFVDLSDRWPSGGYVATAPDLARFGSAVFGVGYLTEAGRKLMLTPIRTVDGEATGVGLGWRLATDDAGRRIAHHGGEAMGSRAFVVVWPDEAVAVALVTNMSFAPIGLEEALRIAELVVP